LGLDGFDVREWIGKADGTTGDGRGDVERPDIERRAATFVFADVAGERGGKFGTGSVVLHVGGVALGIGEDSAGSVDDGGAGSGGLAFLCGDLGEGVRVVDLDAMGEEDGFLGEIAFDLDAERSFPGAAQHDGENAGGGRNDDQEDRQ